MQHYRNSNANALELLQSCTGTSKHPKKYAHTVQGLVCFGLVCFVVVWFWSVLPTVCIVTGTGEIISSVCLDAKDVTLKNMDKRITEFHKISYATTTE